MRKIIVGAALVALAAAPGGAAVLENPTAARPYSGIGVISGWKCEAEGELTVRFNEGDAIPLLYGAERPDVPAAGACPDADVGFITIWNWSILGQGEHTAVAYDDGTEFARATFTVGAPAEAFLEGVHRSALIEQFPAPGETTVLEWNQSSQHFEMVGVFAGEGDAYGTAWWRQMTVDLYVRVYTREGFLYEVLPDVGTCETGELTQAAKDRALEAMNQIRALHHLAPVEYSSLYDEQVMEAALIQAAAGRPRAGHFPAEDARCYTEEGAEGSGSSNLSYTGTGQYSVDPASNMVRWTHDAGNIGHIASVGHRRWVLNPFATYMSYGQVFGHSVHKVFGFDDEPPVSATVDVDYVAFPFQTYPALFMAPDPPWSFTVIEDRNDPWGNRYPYFEDAQIRITRPDTGESLVVTDRAPAPLGGVLNVLSWQVEGWEYDTLYEVEISNVVLQNGTTRDYSYPVFIDREAGGGL